MTVNRFICSLVMAACLTLIWACDGNPKSGSEPDATAGPRAKVQAFIGGTAGVCGGASPEVFQLHVVVPTVHAGDSVLRSYDLKAGAEFVVEIDHIGLVCLDITAPSFQRVRMYPILLRDADTVMINAQLRPYLNDPSDLAGTPAVIGDFNAWDWNAAEPMQLTAAGQWSATIAGRDGDRYQIINAVNNRSINGTQAEKLEYDGAGDYYSHLQLPAGEATAAVTFETAKLPFGDCRELAEHTHVPSRALQGELASMRQLEKDLVAAQNQRLLAGPGDDVPRPSGDVPGMQRSLKKLNGMQADARRFSMLHAGMFASGDFSETLLPAMQAIGPKSPLWTIDGRSQVSEVIPYLMFLGGSSQAAWDFAKSIAQEHPVEDVRARTLFHLLTYANLYPQSEEQEKTESTAVRIDRDRARELYATLLQQHTDSQWLLKARDVNPDRKISPRAPAPVFALPALEDTTVNITVDTVKTPYVLFHFWKPSDQASIRSVSSVSDVLRIVGDDSLTIISVAVAQNRSQAEQIRQTVHPMPWTNAFVYSTSAWAIETLFNVGSYPSYLLVAGDGKILADNAQFRNRGVSDLVRRIVPSANPDNTLGREPATTKPRPSEFSPLDMMPRRGTPMPRRR